MKTMVKTFSFDGQNGLAKAIEVAINTWASQQKIRIVSASITESQYGMTAIVVYEVL